MCFRSPVAVAWAERPCLDSGWSLRPVISSDTSGGCRLFLFALIVWPPEPSPVHLHHGCLLLQHPGCSGLRLGPSATASSSCALHRLLGPPGHREPGRLARPYPARLPEDVAEPGSVEADGGEAVRFTGAGIG